MAEDKKERDNLRSMLLDKAQELLWVKSENERLSKKLMDQDSFLRMRERTIKELSAELKARQKELQQKSQHITELTELLYCSVKPTSPKHRAGISGEPMSMGAEVVKLERHEKDARSKEFIVKAIRNNDFLNNLERVQISEIAECMYEKEFTREQFICREGGVGTQFYVLASGEVQVIKGGMVRRVMKAGVLFGELAILYNCTRTATVKALTLSKVWTLDRSTFQSIMLNTGILRQSLHLSFLKSVPELSQVNEQELEKIANILQEDYYPSGEYILRQGATGDTFFIINEGTVRVTHRNTPDSPEIVIRELSKGDFFGEKALLGDSKRTANIVAITNVSCLTVDKEHFDQLIGEVVSKDYEHSKSLKLALEEHGIPKEYVDIKLEDFVPVATLGMGGFGRVELVKLQKKPSEAFALKCLRKKHVVDTRQQEHIFSEKRIMLQGNCPFIVRLYKTFRCNKYMYMMMEVCLGGELWTILRDRTCFDERTTKFYTACVVEAFDYLHSREIIYRDLKPENLLLDSSGYVKLVDFGFAKHIGIHRKTWTFCGTPEYVAPEIILNRGHDHSADYWSLGILIYELSTGSPPFTESDPMKTYNKILKGIDAIPFPKSMNRFTHSIIKRLCRDNPGERLGFLRGGLKDIRSHRWFEGFNWEGVQNRTMVPPIIPKVDGPCDISNFDHFPKSEDETPPDDLTGWDEDFGPKEETPDWCL